MRACFFTIMIFTLFGAGFAVPPEMPTIVNRYADTRGLWRSLYGMSHFITDFRTRELKLLSLEPWHAFLQEHGSRIIDQEWARTNKEHTTVVTDQTIRQLKQLARSPTSSHSVVVGDDESKAVAAELIREYARRHEDSARAAVVAAHMKLPNDQMLIYPKKHPSWD